MDELLIWYSRKSSRLLPDGWETRVAALVVRTPHWTRALVRRFPQIHVTRLCIFSLCVCGGRTDHTMLNPEVLYVGSSLLIIDLGFYSLKHEAEHFCLLVFHSLTHLTQSQANLSLCSLCLHESVQNIQKVRFNLFEFTCLEKTLHPVPNFIHKLSEKKSQDTSSYFRHDFLEIGVILHFT